MVFKATFNNISVILWRSVLLVEETEYPEKITDLSQITQWQTFSYLNSTQIFIALELIISVQQTNKQTKIITWQALNSESILLCFYVYYKLEIVMSPLSSALMFYKGT